MSLIVGVIGLARVLQMLFVISENMGHRQDMNFDAKDYTYAFIHHVPDVILKPIRRELNHDGNWHKLVQRAEQLDPKFAMK